MKKYVLPVILFFISISFIYSKDVMLFITDRDIGIPIEGAKVLDKTDNKTYSTDKNGKVKFSVKDDINRIIVEITLIGYEKKSENIKEFGKEVEIKIAITGALEGKELVIEDKSAKNKSQLGVSEVIDKNRIKSTAERGIVEDAMSAIKFLPGVSSTGRFNLNFSVRGGDPSELTTEFDGFVIRYPFIWVNTYSIFDPNIIDTIVFNPGIFNVKNGYATSGLVEFNSYKPENGFHFNGDFNGLYSDAFLQTPLGLKNSGLLVGTRISYYNAVTLFNNIVTSNTGASLSTVPFFRDGYLKWYWKPTDRFEWYINSVFDYDGLGASYDGSKDRTNKSGISNDFTVNTANIDTFGVTGFNFLPNDKIHMNFFAGYEYLYNYMQLETDVNGTRDYSDDFINLYHPATSSYTINNFTNNNYNTFKALNSIQTKYNIDFTLNDHITMSAGLGGFYDFLLFGSSGITYRTQFQNGVPSYNKIDYEVDSENKRYLKYFGYVNLDFNIIPNSLEIEAGARIDHAFAYAPSFNNGVLNMYPAPSPRILLTYTPFHQLEWADKISFSIGSGLYSKMSFDDLDTLSSSVNLNDYQFLIPEVLNNDIGMEIDFKYNLVFKIDGYYKYSFNRFYINQSVSSNGKTDYFIHSDGTAQIGGFDVSLERKISKYIDGMISYSFIYARYLNPQTDGDTNRTTTDGDPTGIWYYPSFHQFHILNIELNIRPASFCTITPSFQFESGTPKRAAVGGVSGPFPAQLPNGTIVEMYSQQMQYSDALRNNVYIPFGLKIDFNWFFPKTKVSFDIYVAVDDLFSFLYTPANPTTLNPYTGAQQPSPGANAAFNIPIPNLGIKISF